MVLCFVALPVFLFLALFSAKYRILAWKSLQCVWLKIRFKPCDVGLDTEIKTKLTSTIFARNKHVGRFVYKHFTLLSWVFLILTLLSLFFVVQGGVNFYLYGNCNGPSSDGFCVFDPTGASGATSSVESDTCGIVPKGPDFLFGEKINTSLYYIEEGSEPLIQVVGCFDCEYTRKLFPVIQELRNKDQTFVFAHLPLRNHTLGARAANCLLGTDQYWNFVEDMFALPLGFTHEDVVPLIASYGVASCVEQEGAYALIQAQKENLVDVGIYGTPTVFIGETAVVGPKPKRVYTRLLKQ